MQTLTDETSYVLAAEAAKPVAGTRICAHEGCTRPVLQGRTNAVNYAQKKYCGAICAGRAAKARKKARLRGQA